MTLIPEPLPVNAMPTFTVLTPHYSEKILLSLKEIIREEDQNTRVTLLEYLKQLHPLEWDNFVRDTKILAEESGGFNSYPFAQGHGSDEKSEAKSKADDIPFYTIGFNSGAPEHTLGLHFACKPSIGQSPVPSITARPSSCCTVSKTQGYFWC